MKVIPFGDRILVKRRAIGAKLGNGTIIAPDQIADRPTDLADVIYVPDNTFGDTAILKDNVTIIGALVTKASAGDSDALIALLRLNEYIKLKSIQVGDCILLSKYVGTDFTGKDGKTAHTLVNLQDIIAIIKEK
jgi:co-chaperonin GroES (HSP10)